MSDPPPGRATPILSGPLPAPRVSSVVNITTHRELAGAVRQVAARIAADPEFSPMFAVNPVMTLERYGFKLTPELQEHVAHSIRHPPKILARRKHLEASLTAALGQPPRPQDSAWLADVVFHRFGIPPLDTSGARPAYEPSPHEVMLARLAALRPPRARALRPVRKGGIVSSIGVAATRTPNLLFDLGATVPALPPAAAAPRSLSVDEAWFYKDLNHQVRDLVELGGIMRTGLAFMLPDHFRKIANGEMPNGFRTWFRSIRFPKYEKPEAAP